MSLCHNRGAASNEHQQHYNYAVFLTSATYNTETLRSNDIILPNDKEVVDGHEYIK